MTLVVTCSFPQADIDFYAEIQLNMKTYIQGQNVTMICQNHTV